MVVDPQGGDTEFSDPPAVIMKKSSSSAPARAKDSNEVQGKKRKLEGPTLEPASQAKKSELHNKTTKSAAQIQDADPRRRRKVSAAVPTPSKKWVYDPRTLASDILRAAGRHPTLPPLNWRLMQQEVNRNARLAGEVGRKKKR
ncbi:hypothetical protein MMC34_002143 [Xylographa carneopallida]|nr:hypothetical protein [Xylographa carneopallida]